MDPKNMKEFARELTKVTEQPITVEHIRITGDSVYFEAPRPVVNAPIIMRQDYSASKGFFEVRLHKEDAEKIASRQISAHDYIYNAEWLVGWNKGYKVLFPCQTLISGEYYQPIDIVAYKKDTQRYLKIISCKSRIRSGFFQPSKEICGKCSVQKCSCISQIEDMCDSWEKEYDPRVNFYSALYRRFKREFPYVKVLFSDTMCYEQDARYDSNDDEPIYLIPSGYNDSGEALLKVCVREELMRQIMSLKIDPVDWDKYVSVKFSFMLKNEIAGYECINLSCHHNCIVDNYKKIFRS